MGRACTIGLSLAMVSTIDVGSNEKNTDFMNKFMSELMAIIPRIVRIL